MARFIAFKDEETPHDVFLVTAQEFLDADHFNPAIVSAQTACELVSELALKFHLPYGGRGFSRAVMDLFPSYNLGNERVLRLYVACSGDRIQDETFWADFKKHAQLRHRIVHGGHRSTKEEAEKSVTVARQFVGCRPGTRPSPRT